MSGSVTQINEMKIFSADETIEWKRKIEICTQQQQLVGSQCWKNQISAFFVQNKEVGGKRKVHK